MIHGENCVPEMNDEKVEEQTFTWIDQSAFVADDHCIQISPADPERNQRAKIRGRDSVVQICELLAVRFSVLSSIASKTISFFKQSPFNVAHVIVQHEA